MASRRMFSKDVVCSDRFLDMPASAQDWKASVRTWEKNQRQKNKKSKDDEGLEGWLNA